MEEDDLELTRLTIERLLQVAVAVREQAAARGDPTSGLVADALESVVRRRIAAALAPRPVWNAGAIRWWWGRRNP